MHILVTRPDNAAERTVARLRAAGHEATVQSLMRIEHAPEPIDLVDPAAIVLTSANAVRALAKWPVLADWRKRLVFAVGQATALHARDAGFANIRIGAGNARALFELVRTSINPTAGPLLYPTAADLPDTLPRGLAEAGFSVFAVNAYRRLFCEALDRDVIAGLASGEIDGALFYSRETASVFARLARKQGIADQLGNVAFYAFSEPVAQALEGLDPAGISVAERPNERSLLSLLPVSADRE